MFDNLTYQYDIDPNTHQMGSNRLYHLDDAIVTANTIDDLEDQGTFNPTVLTNNNYRYDEIGNLTQDVSENIGEVKWNVWGKIREIITTSNATEAQNIEYRYDATGNRYAKILKPVNNGLVSDESQWTTWFYLRDAQGNPMALYKRTYEDLAGNAWKQHFKLEELSCYGSSRLGVLNLSIPDDSEYPDVWMENFTATLNTEGRFVVTAYGTIVTPPASNLYSHRCGIRNYEFTNHLGNVLYTFTDHKLPHTTNNQSIDYYLTDITSAQDYYPFGMLMPNRSFSPDKYRFGFNGKENDNDVKGTGNQQDYGMRIYDPRIVKFLSVDPIADQYPWYTPYQFAGNTPIQAIDLDGLEPWRVNGQGGTSSFSYAFTGTIFGPYKDQEAANSAAYKRGNTIYDFSFSAKAVTAGTTGINSSTTFILTKTFAGHFPEYTTGDNIIPSVGELGSSSGNLSYDISYNSFWNGRSTGSGAVNSTDVAGTLVDLLVREPIQYGLEQAGMGENAAYWTSSGLTLAGMLGIGKIKYDATNGGSKYLYHYTSEAAAQSISKTGLRTGKDGFLYLTNKSGLSPLQAQIELALPANRALPNSILRINTSGLTPAAIRRVQGNLPGLGAGGGTEFLFNQTIPPSAIKIIR